MFDESFYPRKSHRKESSIISSYDAHSNSQRQNESPKSTKLMHTLDRRLQYLSKVQVKIEGAATVNCNSILDTQNASESGIPNSARNSSTKNNYYMDIQQFNSVILPQINNQSDKDHSKQEQILSTRNQSDQSKRFYLKEEFLDGYSINGSQFQQQSQQFQSASPASKNKSKFISLRSNSKQQRSPTNSVRQSGQTPRYHDISQFLADQDSSICYDKNYESTLSLNYQGKTLDHNQVKQIPSIINELSTMIDGTFKEGKKFDDPKILQTFYKSIRQIIEIDLSHIEEQKLDKNHKNKIQQFNDKIDSLKDKLVQIKEIEDQISKTLSINDDMLQSQKKLIRIKKQYDKTLDNIDFFMQILEQYDYPESSTSMVMLKMKQNEYKEMIELQQQSASEYRECMLDPTNPANNVTAYRYDRIRKIKEFIKQKKIRNAQKLTNF